MKMRYLYLLLKRLFDIGCALLGLIVSLPLWLIVTLGIELSDPGPVFYIARRTTKDDRVFNMFKFRSMRRGKANESVFRGDEDRIFPFGAFIRMTKLDELPQLLNILIGDMSVVGPRPASVEPVHLTRGGRFARTSDVQSGLTGPYVGRTVRPDRTVGPLRLSLRRSGGGSGGLCPRCPALPSGAGPGIP